MTNSHNRNRRCFFCGLVMKDYGKEVPLLSQDQSQIGYVVVCTHHQDPSYIRSDGYNARGQEEEEIE